MIKQLKCPELRSNRIVYYNKDVQNAIIIKDTEYIDLIGEPINLRNMEVRNIFECKKCIFSLRRVASRCLYIPSREKAPEFTLWK